MLIFNWDYFSALSKRNIPAHSLHSFPDHRVLRSCSTPMPDCKHMCPMSGGDDTKETKITHYYSPQLFISLENDMFHDFKKTWKWKNIKRSIKKSCYVLSLKTTSLNNTVDLLLIREEFRCVCVCMNLPMKWIWNTGGTRLHIYICILNIESDVFL